MLMTMRPDDIRTGLANPWVPAMEPGSNDGVSGYVNINTGARLAVHKALGSKYEVVLIPPSGHDVVRLNLGKFDDWNSGFRRLARFLALRQDA